MKKLLAIIAIFWGLTTNYMAADTDYAACLGNCGLGLLSGAPTNPQQNTCYCTCALANNTVLDPTSGIACPTMQAWSDAYTKVMAALAAQNPNVAAAVKQCPKDVRTFTL